MNYLTSSFLPGPKSHNLLHGLTFHSASIIFTKNLFMRMILSLIAVAIIAASANAQVEIKTTEVLQHVGDSVTITDTVMSGRFLSSSKGGPTLLNVGGLYPNQLLTLVIWSIDRKNFEDAPEVLYVKKAVKVTGKVELFKDKPQIVLHSDKQITVVPGQDIVPSQNQQLP
jgi:hypothetical protein